MCDRRCLSGLVYVRAKNASIIRFAAIQQIIPQAVGSKNPAAVHFMLLVSFQIVIIVVEQGKCIRVNIIMHTAVFIVQPFSVRSCKSPAPSAAFPFEPYIISMIGRTISFAGKPRINPVSISPLSPIIFPSGERKSQRYIITGLSFIIIVPISQITAPAGAATAAALPSIRTVLSNTERMIVFPIWGIR